MSKVINTVGGGGSDNVVTLSPTLTKTSGNSSVVSVTGTRIGNIVQITYSLKNGTDTAPGSNSFVGTLSNCPLPRIDSFGSGFYGMHIFYTKIATDGAFAERVVQDGGYWSANDTHTVSVMYITG